MSIPIVMYTRKNFFLIEELNEKLEAFKAAGLIVKWYKDDLNQTALNEKESIAPRIISTHDVLGSFQILSFGLVGSFIVFLTEISKGFLCLLKKNFLYSKLTFGKKI